MSHAIPAPDSMGLLNQLLSCRQFDDLQGDLLDPLSNMLLSMSAALIQLTRSSAVGEDLPTHVVKRSLHVGPLTRAIKSYADGDFRLDPIFDLEANRVHRFSMRKSRANSGDTFQRFLQRHDIYETIGVTLPVQTMFGTEIFALSFQ